MIAIAAILSASPALMLSASPALMLSASPAAVILSAAKDLCIWPPAGTVAFFVASSDPAWMLFLCAVMAVALFVYTFRAPSDLSKGAEKTRLIYLRERKEQVYENLRDLNFEYKAGKFPQGDYEQMRTSIEDEAAALLAEIERLEAAQKIPVYRGAAGVMKKSNPKGARS
jgi:hypothetical protein